MKTIEFAPKKRVIIGRIATKSEVKAADHANRTLDDIIIEIVDDTETSTEIWIHQNHADGFNFGSDLFIGNVLHVEVEECIGNVTQYYDEKLDDVFVHLEDHLSLDKVRAATDDEITDFLQGRKLNALVRLYNKHNQSYEFDKLIDKANNDPSIENDKFAIREARKEQLAAYTTVYASKKSATVSLTVDEQIANLRSRRDALAANGGNAASVAAYDRKISILESTKTPAQTQAPTTTSNSAKAGSRKK
jgi:hypothetical protein